MLFKRQNCRTIDWGIEDMFEGKRAFQKQENTFRIFALNAESTQLSKSQKCVLWEEIRGLVP